MRPTFFVQYMPEHAGKEFRVKIDTDKETIVVRVAVDYELLRSGKYDELQIIRDIADEAHREAEQSTLSSGVTVVPGPQPLGAFELKPPRWLR